MKIRLDRSRSTYGWPDAAHVGVPLNSERDAWHFPIPS